MDSEETQCLILDGLQTGQLLIQLLLLLYHLLTWRLVREETLRLGLTSSIFISRHLPQAAAGAAAVPKILSLLATQQASGSTRPVLTTCHSCSLSAHLKWTMWVASQNRTGQTDHSCLCQLLATALHLPSGFLSSTVSNVSAGQSPWREHLTSSQT